MEILKEQWLSCTRHLCQRGPVTFSVHSSSSGQPFSGKLPCPRLWGIPAPRLRPKLRRNAERLDAERERGPSCSGMNPFFYFPLFHALEIISEKDPKSRRKESGSIRRLQYTLYSAEKHTHIYTMLNFFFFPAISRYVLSS